MKGLTEFTVLCYTFVTIQVIFLKGKKTKLSFKVLKKQAQGVLRFVKVQKY